MKPSAIIGIVGLLALVLAAQVLPGCNYARMDDDEAVNAYETSPPAMPQSVVPVDGGLQALVTADIRTLRNPLPAGVQTLKRGQRQYGYYCLPCHGPNLDGSGTVGQSFAPVPTDLGSAYVLDQPDGQLMHRIGLGFKRHPPLARSVEIDDLWSVIAYLRSRSRPGNG